MQVEPARLVELARSSERILDAMGRTGLTPSTSSPRPAWRSATRPARRTSRRPTPTALADADEVLTSLAEALELGVAGLVDAAHDALRADDTVAAELDRATHQLGEGPFGTMPGRGRSLTVPANPWELRADVRPLEARRPAVDRGRRAGGAPR